MKKYLHYALPWAVFSLLMAFAAGPILIAMAEQGDYATFGYDSTNKRSIWRVSSSRELIPSVTDNNDIGNTGLRIRAIYVTSGMFTSDDLRSDAVITSKIIEGAVTTPKIRADSVITSKIMDANVTTSKLGNDSVISSKILDAAVTTGKIAVDSVTTAKLSFYGGLTSGRIACITTGFRLGQCTGDANAAGQCPCEGT